MSRIKHAFFYAVAIPFCIITLLSCSRESPMRITGGSSGTEVSAVSGFLFDIDGNPVANAIVRIRPEDYIVDSATSESYRKSHSIRDTITDENGLFSVEAILPNVYTIEASAGDSISTLLSIHVEPGKSSYQLAPDTLLPMSWVNGMIHIEYDDRAVGRVQVFGLERAALSDSNGNFAIMLPKGPYIFHVGVAPPKQPGFPSSHIGTMDIKLDVGTGERRDIGSFNLELQPVQPCFDGTCDSIVLRAILDTLGFTNLPLDSFCTRQNGRIVSVSFRNRTVAFIPRDMVKLMSVTFLDLGKTQITALFSDIGIMRNIETLFLDSNNLEMLPVEIGKLDQCTNLNLSANNLQFLPPIVTFLKPVVALNLSGNRLCRTDSTFAAWATRYDPDWQAMQVCP